LVLTDAWNDLNAGLLEGAIDAVLLQRGRVLAIREKSDAIDGHFFAA